MATILGFTHNAMAMALLQKMNIYAYSWEVK